MSKSGVGVQDDFVEDYGSYDELYNKLNKKMITWNWSQNIRNSVFNHDFTNNEEFSMKYNDCIYNIFLGTVNDELSD